jgi:formylaminopyrimidine deformylase / aminopyrimidine aminohydrolase
MGAEWAAATRHPFLAGVRDGTISDAAFDTWLGQDQLFARDLLWFQARLLARAPRDAGQVLVDGCAALVAELAWFEDMAAARGLALPERALPGTADYRRLLERLDTAPQPVALAALWAIERVYLDAWRYAAPGAEQFRAFVEHWTVPEFAGYVDALAVAADAYPEADGVDEAVRAVLRAESGFWDTAWAAGQS